MPFCPICGNKYEGAKDRCPDCENKPLPTPSYDESLYEGFSDEEVTDEFFINQLVGAQVYVPQGQAPLQPQPQHPGGQPGVVIGNNRGQPQPQPQQANGGQGPNTSNDLYKPLKQKKGAERRNVLDIDFEPKTGSNATGSELTNSNTTESPQVISQINSGGESAGGEITDPTAESLEELMFKSEDFVSALGKMGWKRIKLQGQLYIECKITLTLTIYEQYKNNAVVAKDIKDNIAQKEFDQNVNSVLDNIKTALAHLDEKYQGEDAELSAYVPFALKSICDSQERLIKKKIEDRIARYIETNKGIKKAYKHYRCDCIFKVVTNVISISGSAAVTGLSFGATGPVAIVAISRSCVDLVWSSIEMWMDVKTLIKEIEAYLKTVEELTKAAKTDNDTLTKALDITREVTLEAIAKVLSVRLPTVTEVSGKLKSLIAKIQGIIVTRLECGEKIHQLQVEIARYSEDANDLDSEKLKKREEKVKRLTETRMKIESKAAAMFELILSARDKHHELEERLEVCKTSKHLEKWGELSGTIVGAGTSLALSGAGGDGDMQHVVELLNECANIVKDEVEKKT
jgi:hypothetical protein